MRSGRTAQAIAPALFMLCLAACAGLAPSPTPVPTSTIARAPTATLPPPTSTLAPGQPTPEPTAQPGDIEDAFLTNVDDLIAEAADLAVTPCQDLTAVTQANPNLVPSVRGFATALKRIGTSQPALDTDAVRTSLADLDHSMGQLEGALSLCGIK